MKRYLFAGLIVWVPILGTFYILRFIIQMLDGTLALIPSKYHPDQLLGVHIPGTGLVVTLLILLITGILATNILGKQMVKAWDQLLNKIPLVRGIYNAFKQIMTTIVSPSNKSFRKVLLVEYPRRGLWSIGFQTSTQFGAAPLADDMLMVFLPTTPNPTSGFLMVIPKQDTMELDVSVEDALKIIISLGVIIPEHLQSKTTPPTTPGATPKQGPQPAT